MFEGRPPSRRRYPAGLRLAADDGARPGADEPLQSVEPISWADLVSRFGIARDLRRTLIEQAGKAPSPPARFDALAPGQLHARAAAPGNKAETGVNPFTSGNGKGHEAREKARVVSTHERDPVIRGKHD